MVNRNKNGQFHGLCESYFGNGKISDRMEFYNGNCHGLNEHYYFSGQLCFKGIYIYT